MRCLISESVYLFVFINLFLYMIAILLLPPKDHFYKLAYAALLVRVCACLGVYVCVGLETLYKRVFDVVYICICMFRL